MGTLGSAARFVKCDVTQESDGQAVVDAALSLGPLRGLVNCAGIAIGRRRSARTVHIRWMRSSG